jgi:5-amino-6-(5-phosphoribosylamino)uracil reductase
MDAKSWQARFAAFGAKKTRAAVASTLPAYTTDREQPIEDMLPIGNQWTRELFGGAFYVSPNRDPNRPSCSLVFVRSADGNTGTTNPADLGGGQTDQHLIYEGLSRVAADAVLAGAGTAGDGDAIYSVWHPELVNLRASLGLARHPIQMVATLRGIDIDRMLLFNVPDLPAIVLTVSECATRLRDVLSTRPWITAVLMEDGRDIRHAFDQLSALGVRRVSCIGGRHLARSLLEASLIDDVYLTTAPRRGGEPNTPLPSAASSGRLIVRKCGTLAEAGVAFEHFTIAGAAISTAHAAAVLPPS